MNVHETIRGFIRIDHERYTDGERTKLVQESSIIGGHGEVFDYPGSGFLWVGEDHLLNRDEVRQFIGILQHWIDTGRLPI